MYVVTEQLTEDFKSYMNVVVVWSWRYFHARLMLVGMNKWLESKNLEEK
jgi:hypothetical protein